MSFLMLLILVSFGGGCGGLASAIAQPNAGQPYKIRLPFLLNKEKTDSKIVSLGCLGNILTGSAASIAIFFIAGPLFNLEPKYEDIAKLSVNVTQQANATNPNFYQSLEQELFLPFKKDPVLFFKLFSLSVAAGFAGIHLMERLANQVLDKVEHVDKEASVVGKVTQVTPAGEITSISVAGTSKEVSDKSESTSQTATSTTDTQVSDRFIIDRPELLLENPELKAELESIIALLHNSKHLQNDIKCDENGKCHIQLEAATVNGAKLNQ